MKQASLPLILMVGLLGTDCEGALERNVGHLSDSKVPKPGGDALRSGAAATPTKTLTIRWQRLVNKDGGTCDRCAGTDSAIREAERSLSPALAALGVRVVLEEHKMDAAEFEKTPDESNRIWIGGKTLEEILGATTGSSRCGGVCGGKTCRTLVVAGVTYESIPPALIVRAALKTAADLFAPGRDPPPASTRPVSGGACGCGEQPAVPTPCCGSR